MQIVVVCVSDVDSVDTASDADCEQSDEEDGGNAKATTRSLATVISGILRKKPTKHKVILAKAKTDKCILLAKHKGTGLDADGEDGTTAKRIRKTGDATLTDTSVYDQREERLKVCYVLMLLWKL